MTEVDDAEVARPRGVTIAWAVGSLVVGVFIGVLGAFVQAQRLLMSFLDSVPSIPWGVLIALVALVCAIRGATWGMGSRWGGWLLLAGWVAATVLLSAESPSGDLALSGGVRQVGYLIGGVIVGSAAATLPLPVAKSER